MRISVIIPHYNQPEYLRVCLTTLRQQADSTADLEIIVVDNGSKRLPDDICAEFPDVQLLQETTPGPGPARNLGANTATGDILAFIDADCHAHDHWLSAIETAFQSSSTQVIGGDVQVKYATPGHPTFLEPYESIYSYRNHEHIAEGYSGTGNLAMRAEIFHKVGPFVGLGVAEDKEWGLRAGAMGFTTIYVADMIAYHPARKTFAELAQKWDRHIAHAYPDYVTTSAGKARWLIRAIAMAGSPLAEIRTILRSRRVGGGQERLLAFLCLAKVRLYRSRRMLSMLLGAPQKDLEGDWSR
ncbi:glycosyltransferase [Ruegeria sp.]|uniref:glycosyltransferase family 2 protein n=1 Tax=Ruegeria sp. TaxID=1879320 RepID=UPI002317825C|nr:glycosyltransferase [Ruegeria sp.]MDA7964887.1 glycosyltransferase [Ruegeria sp.]